MESREDGRLRGWDPCVQEAARGPHTRPVLLAAAHNVASPQLGRGMPAAKPGERRPSSFVERYGSAQQFRAPGRDRRFADPGRERENTLSGRARDLDSGGFARAVRADDAEDLALPDRKRNAVDRARHVALDDAIRLVA